VRRADNRITSMCRLSLNLGTSTSWSSQGLSRPVQDCLLSTKATFVTYVSPDFQVTITTTVTFITMVTLVAMVTIAT